MDVLNLPFALPTAVAGITLSKDVFRKPEFLESRLQHLESKYPIHIWDWSLHWCLSEFRLSSVPCSRCLKNSMDSMRKRHLCLEPTGCRPFAECYHAGDFDARGFNRIWACLCTEGSVNTEVSFTYPETVQGNIRR